MIALGRSLSAEILKMKRTLGLWLALAAPVAVVLLNLARYLQRPASTLPKEGDPWVAFMGDVLVYWALIMLPLAITVETSLLGSLEHGNHTWKQLFALPVPRWTVYTAKQLCAWGMTGLSNVIYFAGMIVIGLALRTLRPETRLAAPIPWAVLATSVLLAYLGSWLVSALQLWISTHWSSFVLAMGVGIVATVGGIMLVQSDWVRWYPWTMAGAAAVQYLRHELHLVPVIVAVLGGILLSVGGAWEVTKRDVF